MSEERDLLILAKTIAANDFPVERPSIIGVDRETGQLLRVSPFPWKGSDTDPPLLRWAWVHAGMDAARYDPRPGTHEHSGEVAQIGYVDAKDAWRLRWPFVRPHEHASVASFLEVARAGSVSAGFIRPSVEDGDVLQLPLRLRFRCASDECPGVHELPVLDWELHEMARLARERYGPTWATRFRDTWGAALFRQYDVRILLSSYAQAPARAYVAGLFYPPREREDAHEHAHHLAHREHGAPS